MHATIPGTVSPETLKKNTVATQCVIKGLTHAIAVAGVDHALVAMTGALSGFVQQAFAAAAISPGCGNTIAKELERIAAELRREVHLCTAKPATAPSSRWIRPTRACRLNSRPTPPCPRASARASPRTWPKRTIPGRCMCAAPRDSMR